MQVSCSELSSGPVEKVKTIGRIYSLCSCWLRLDDFQYIFSVIVPPICSMMHLCTLPSSTYSVWALLHTRPLTSWEMPIIWSGPLFICNTLLIGSAVGIHMLCYAYVLVPIAGIGLQEWFTMQILCLAYNTIVAYSFKPLLFIVTFIGCVISLFSRIILNEPLRHPLTSTTCKTFNQGPSIICWNLKHMCPISQEAIHSKFWTITKRTKENMQHLSVHTMLLQKGWAISRTFHQWYLITQKNNHQYPSVDTGDVNKRLRAFTDTHPAFKNDPRASESKPSPSTVPRPPRRVTPSLGLRE